MKVELLAPAGSYESSGWLHLKPGRMLSIWAVQKFGARAYADNLDQEQLIRKRSICAHLKWKDSCI